MKENFYKLKKDILKREKLAIDRNTEYQGISKAETLADLMKVIKNNFWLLTGTKVIDCKIIEKYKTEFNSNDIWYNENCTFGFLLCDNATVEASGNTTVVGINNAIIIARDIATVVAGNNTTIIAYDSATVISHDISNITAYDRVKVESFENSGVIAYHYTTVKAHDNTKITAYDSTYIQSYFEINCKLFDNAIHRIEENNTIRFSSDSIKFVR